MSGFSAEWLALREPYDRAARNAVVLAAVADAFRGQSSIAVTDLACGTGATLRAVGPDLLPRQNWRLVDNNLSLLAQASTLAQPPHVTVTARPVDLALILNSRSTARSTSSPHRRCSISCRRNGSTVSLSRRRRGGCRSMPRSVTTAAPSPSPARRSMPRTSPRSTGTSALTRASARRWGRPRPARAAERFGQFGYVVVQGPSDWVLGPDDRVIQEALFAGWAELAALTAVLSTDETADWLAQRRAHLAAGRSRLRIGHVDIFARPIATR